MNTASPRRPGWLARALGMAMPVLLCGRLVAAPVPAEQPVPPPAGHLVDTTATLSAAQAADIEQRLAAFEDRKGSQLAVLIVPTTAPEAIEPYALRAAGQWKLGRRTIDDGALLVVARDDHAVRIEVGYGLEGALNDATCKRIISETIVPRFQAGDLPGGIAAGVEQMMRVVDGEPLPPPAPAGQDPWPYVPMVVMAALGLGFVLRALMGRVGGSLAAGGIVGLATWWLAGTLWVAMMATLLAAAVALLGGLGLLPVRGPFGGGGPGRRGGGGGGFGGGGASGRW